jgi:hypothetical protein
MIDEPSPPRRTPLAGGEWIRFRCLPRGGGTSVLTGADGRFLLLPADEIDALRASEPGDVRRRKLSELGFLLPADGEGPRGPAVSSDSSRHVMMLRGTPAEAGASATAMDQDTACAVIDHIAGSGPTGGAAGFHHVEVRGDPLDSALVRRIASRVETARAAGARLSLGLRTDLAGTTPDLADALIDARAVITVTLGGPPSADEIARLRGLHARYSARGIPPSLAFVRVVLPVGRAAIAAGIDRLLPLCIQSGIVFLELAPGGGDVTLAEHVDSYRAAIPRILEINARGTLLVEMPLALHLETLVAGADPSRTRPDASPTTVIWGPDGRPLAGETTFPAIGCAGCAYDPHCGTGLLRDALEDVAARRWGTPFCHASTGMFDTLFELLASPEAPRLRRVFRAWMAVHERVARRLSAPAEPR